MADTSAKLEIIASVKDQMTKVLRTAQTSFKTFFGAVGSGFSSLGKAIFSVKGLLAGAFAFLGGRALANHTEELTRAVAQYELWSQRLGISVGYLDELTLMAEQQGQSFEGLTANLKQLLNAQDKASQGAGEMREQFRRLGVSAVDPLTGQLVELPDLLGKIHLAFAELRGAGRGGEISRISDDLLGGSDGALATLLQQSPAALAALEDLAFGIGRVTDEQARMGVVVSQAFVEFNRSIQSFQLQVLTDFGAEIVATLRTAAQFLRENSKDIVAFLAEVGAIGLGIIKTVGSVTIAVVRSVLDAIDFITQKIGAVTKGLSGVWTLVTQGPFAAIAQAQGAAASAQARGSLNQLEGQVISLGDVFAAFSMKWATQWESNQAAASRALAAIPEASQRATEKLTAGWDDFWSGWGDGFQQWRRELAEFNRAGKQASSEVFSSVNSNFATFLADVMKGTDTVKHLWKNMLRSILEDWIDSFAKMMSNALLDGLFNGLLGGIFSGGGSSGLPNNFIGPPLPGGRNGSPLSVPGGGGMKRMVGAGFGAPSIGGGGQVFITNNYINAIDARSFEQRLAESSKTLHAIHADGLHNNQALRALARRR